MQQELVPRRKFYTNDLLSGLVVFLVALPLCLGIASASGAPLISGIIAGVIGGIVIGYLSGSHISVSGPAAGLAPRQENCQMWGRCCRNNLLDWMP